MAKIAFVFPGQGSQRVGMGKELCEADAHARALFERADEVLGRSLSRLCFEGPEAELMRSANTQPALLVVSAILYDMLRRRGLEATAVAGHSLGEYSALHAAGVFDFETAVGLVARRGEAMSLAAEARPGAMAAVMGLERDAADAVCSEAGGVVGVANDNCPGQLVISGEREAVERASALAREKGAKRVVPLPVQGAFHSSLMAPARDVMAEALAAVAMGSPDKLFVANVLAASASAPDAIRNALVDQVTGSVRWRESIDCLVDAGYDTFVEVGWGNVLTGMMKRGARGARAFSVQGVKDIDDLAAALA